MILDDVIVPLVCGAAGAMALRLVLAAVENFRAPKPSGSPSRAIGMGSSGPYRALATVSEEHARLGLELADEAVRRERARIAAIVRAAGEADGTSNGVRIATAIERGISGET